jgi:hypothetical protein
MCQALFYFKKLKNFETNETLHFIAKKPTRPPGTQECGINVESRKVPH